MSAYLASLIKDAETAAGAGQWDRAEKLWRQVREADPANPKAAFNLGVHAMQRRDFRAACDLIEEARRHMPGDAFLLLTLSKARRETGDDAGEGEAIDAALAIDPYFLPALLAKAQRLERLKAPAAAAMNFRIALQISPPETQLPPGLRSQLAHAREVVARFTTDFDAHLSAAIAPLMGDLSRAEAERWREAASIMSGATRPYRQEANQLLAPRLPAIPFYDREMFAWAADVEAKTDLIRDELTAALAADGKDFQPYIALRPGQPVDEWNALNHSTRWSHYSLWRNGKPDEAHLSRCPQTREALAAAELAVIDGLCPNAMFSALAAHTEIPPHTGETNARLVAHLPLIVPEKCSYRVGYERREWRVGELLVFDDTIEHTARNDSDELRVILLFDIWNPLLSLRERDVVAALAKARRSYGV